MYFTILKIKILKYNITSFLIKLIKKKKPRKHKYVIFLKIKKKKKMLMRKYI